MRFVDLNRSFVPIKKDKEASLDIGRTWGRKIAGWLDWDELLKYQRVVLLAEASSGKTEEFRNSAQALAAAGGHAFFVRVEDLADDGFEQALESPEVARAFERWRALDDGGNGPEARFFLDSVDEARLNNKSFEKALRRLARELGGALERSRVFASCRVSDWKGSDDREAFTRILPVRARPERIADQSAADASLLDPIFKERSRNNPGPRQRSEPRPFDELIVVQLVPLSWDQRQQLATASGVSDAESFGHAITENGLDTLAERPGDLLDLADYWTSYGQFGTLSEMIEHGVARKLTERAFRPDNRDLDSTQARQGAERVAGALTLAKSFTLRAPGHNADPTLASGALDPVEVLPEWTEAQRNSLTRRGVFTPSTYGRVRFHHRGTQEYLAANWLDRLLKHGCPRSAVHDLLFADLYGVPTVVPSLRATAAWLAREYPDVRDTLLQREPLVLLREGDPRSLPLDSKEQLLLTYAERHASGEISDDSLDHRALWMFSTPLLANAIRLAWGLNAREGFRVDLLRLIREGPVTACADLARLTALDVSVSDILRTYAVESLAACGDHDALTAVAALIRSRPAPAGSQLAIDFARFLFPCYLSTDDLLFLIESAAPDRKKSLGRLGWALKQFWRNCPHDEARLRFCDGLGQLCLTPPFVSDYRRVSVRFAELSRDLGQIARDSVRRFGERAPLPLLMAVERAERDHSALNDDKPSLSLEELVNSHAGLKRSLFWADVEETRRNATQTADRPSAVWHIYFSGNPLWQFEQSDRSWLEADVCSRDLEDDRRIALSAVVRLLHQAQKDTSASDPTLRSHEPHLRMLMAGGGERLAEDLTGYLSPPAKPSDAEREKRGVLREQKVDEAREKKDKASWVRFREEVSADPTILRDPARLSNWKDGSQKLEVLTRWLRRRTDADYEDAARQWRLLEEGFGRAVAEAYRDGMKVLWRITEPARPDRGSGGAVTEKYPTILSMSGIGIEATEDEGWAARLTEPDTHRAVAHARLSERGHPEWIDGIIASRPSIALPVLREMLVDEWSGRLPGYVSPMGHYTRSNTSIPSAVADIIVEIVSGPCADQLDIFDRGLRLLLRISLDESSRAALRRLSLRRLRAAAKRGTEEWLSRHFAMLFQVDADRGVQELATWLDRLTAPSGAGSGRVLAGYAEDDFEIAPCRSTIVEHVLGTMFGREDRLLCSRALKIVNVGALTGLVRLAYRHIRPQDDIEHEGSYTPGRRDAAQEARNVILGALLDRSGADAYRAVRELAADPLFEARWHRFNELAHGMAERDAELPAWSPLEVFHFERTSVAPAKTGDALLKVVTGVLSDINADLTGIGSDSSSRALLQRAEVEEEVQQWLAEQMNLRAVGRFHAHREAQVAGGDKPDIIVSSTASAAEVAVEVKHGGQGWSVRDLESALNWQLAENYLKPVNRRHGVLVVSHHGDRSWRAPEDRAVLSFENVMTRLQEKAEGRTVNRVGAISLRAIGIDASRAPDLRRRERH
ncbi:hypothetical protein [Methylobacterium sp. Leaf93]|uniref:hypothetical protein n=1 Tax=Methylobacterium sp. Leaf93 TaxID=1736249 RepID=UPI0012E965A9|nr:hypothetical protein [Methylobacterium sp. Leaf93]